MKAAGTLWRVPVALGEIPADGLHRDVEADADTRRAIAEMAGLRELTALSASFDLTPSRDQIHVTGRVRARVGQTCVVTLDPVENTIDEPVDVMFSDDPPAQAANAPGEDGDDLETDPPEPILGGVIDLGALASEFMILALDPYPRKPGAVFEPVVAPDDPADHPFAGLAALKDGDLPRNPRKSKGK